MDTEQQKSSTSIVDRNNSNLDTEAASAPMYDEKFENAIAPELDLGQQWTLWE